jgi:hypothetical protein
LIVSLKDEILESKVLFVSYKLSNKALHVSNQGFEMLNVLSEKGTVWDSIVDDAEY